MCSNEPEVGMPTYKLCELRAHAAARSDIGYRSESLRVLPRIFGAKFGWAFDYTGDRDFLPGAVVLRREMPAVHDPNGVGAVASLDDSVLEQLATRPFASAMEIDYNGKLYVLANMEYLCFTRSEDEALKTATPTTFMARMLEAEAIGKPLEQYVLNRLHEIVIFPKELLDP